VDFVASSGEVEIGVDTLPAGVCDAGIENGVDCEAGVGVGVGIAVEIAPDGGIGNEEEFEGRGR